MENIKVKIYQPTKTVTQSGKAKRYWIIKPESEENHRKMNDLMGWVSSNSTEISQLRFKFNKKEDAVKFAHEYGLDYFIEEPNISSFKPKSYSANFTS